MIRLKFSKIFQGDKVIWVVFFFLCIISLVEVFSAASTLSYKSGSFWTPFWRQAQFLGLGALVVICIHNIPCRWFKLVPLFFLVFTWLLLLITLFFGNDTNEAKRWLDIFGLSFQPSELAKGVVVTTVALILAAMQHEEGADRRAFKFVLIITFITCGLIVAENLSTAALLFAVVFIMMFVGRVSLVQMGKLLGACALFIGLFVAVIFLVFPDNRDAEIYKTRPFHRVLTWKDRISDHREATKVVSPKDLDFDNDAQAIHANIAIASSGGIGRMPGNSVERDFLSQAFSDFIFAIIIEEMGLWGAIIVVFLYLVLMFRAGRIASRCERNFPAFLIMGLALLLVFQAFTNMLVAVGILPVTGQPLPLISRGGTSTIITCAYFGMMLSVSRYARKTDTRDEQQQNTDLAQAEFQNDKDLV